MISCFLDLFNKIITFDILQYIIAFKLDKVILAKLFSKKQIDAFI